MPAGEQRVGFAILDAASARVRIGSVAVEPGESALRTLLAQTAPCEVLHVQGGLHESAMRLLKDPNAGWAVTAVNQEDSVAPAAAEGVLGAWKELQAAARAVAALSEGHRPAEALAALCTLLGHVKRLHLLAALGDGLTVRPHTTHSCERETMPSLRVSRASSSAASHRARAGGAVRERRGAHAPGRRDPRQPRGARRAGRLARRHAPADARPVRVARGKAHAARVALPPAPGRGHDHTAPARRSGARQGAGCVR